MSKQIITQFYQAFQNHDAEAMASMYHEEATFSDPVFQNLSAEQTRNMWRMLIERAKGELEIEFHTIIGDNEIAQCVWEAKYKFSKTKNEVHNIIHATMHFKDGLIINHKDEFNLWRWSSMALGLPGKLLGWSPFIKNKIRKTAMGSLDHYESNH